MQLKELFTEREMHILLELLDYDSIIYLSSMSIDLIINKLNDKQIELDGTLSNLEDLELDYNIEYIMLNTFNLMQDITIILSILNRYKRDYC